MQLGELITRLEAANPDQIVAHGFHNPHSYRGDYYDLAFEPTANITVADILEAARSAVGTTYQGWKGGDFTMSEHTWCWLSDEGDASGETISPLLLDLMLEPAAAPASDDERRDRYATALAQITVGHRAFIKVDVQAEYKRADAVIAIADAEQAELRRERDLAIAHDRQPYPTAWAYEQACKALNQKTDVIDQVRAMHRKRTERHGSGCVQCGIVWPCPTYQALEVPAPTTEA